MAGYSEKYFVESNNYCSNSLAYHVLFTEYLI